MKFLKTALLIILLFSAELSAQFNSAIPIVSLADRVRFVEFADLNGDGNLDVLSTSVGDNKTAWYPNIGDGTFDHQRIISQAVEPEIMAVADVDMDGDVDLFLSSSGDEKVYLFMNDGTGEMSLSQVVLDGYRDVHNLLTADMDGDGDLDLVAGSLKGKEIVWFANNGQGFFGSKKLITNQSNWWTEIEVSDINGDGHMDVLASSEGEDQIMWFLNDGNGVFGEPQILPIEITFTYGIRAFDVDMDGDNDIVFRYSINSAEGHAKRMVWLENDGVGNFSEEQFISDVIGFVSFVDMNSDGDMDILSTTNQPSPSIQFLENNGNGVFNTSQSFTIGDDRQLERFFLQDLNNDNQLDIITVPRTVAQPSNEILWFQNVGSSGFVKQLEIVHTMRNPCFVQPIDLDEDEDMDLLIGSEEILYWYENDGEEHFHRRHIFDSDFEGLTDISLIDLDKDGNSDILFANESTLFWYRKIGSSSFADKEVLYVHDAEILNFEMVDLEKDGDLDIVIGSRIQGEALIWVENMGSEVFETNHLISTGGSYFRSIVIVDIDKDGFDDIVAGADSYGYNITWYRNTTGDEEEELEEWQEPDNRLFKEVGYIGRVREEVTVATADLDGNNTIDVVVSSERGDEIVWFSNDGEGGFGEEQIIESDLEYARYVQIVDFDSDGDMDLAALASSDAGRIVWFENKGDATFEPAQWVQTPIARTDYNLTTFLVEDVNSDGKADFLLSGCEDDHLYWFENTITGVNIPPLQLTNLKPIKVFPNPFSDYTTIEVGGLLDGNYRLQVMDILGRKVQELDLENGKVRLERGDLEKGLYLIRVLEEKNERVLGSEKVLVE